MRRSQGFRRNESGLSAVFDVFNTLFLASYAVLAVVPFLYVVAGSFASAYEFRTRDFFIVPGEWSFLSYQYIFSSDRLLRAMGMSVLRTVLGTIISMLLTVTMAYPLSRRKLKGRNVILNCVIFTMMFSGGMIPTFLVVKGLGLFDRIWALVLPGAISASSMIIVKTFFQDLPPGLEEAATIDGANDLQVLWRIALPLSVAVIATFSLFYAVGQWNAFFDALIYLNNNKLWPLQVILRQMVTVAQGTLGDATMLDPNTGSVPEDGVKMAVIVVSTVPILMVYPFIQRHFTKGVMIGAIKG